jgi:hypothetical protein
MHFIYDGNATAALRIYNYWYPDWRQPNVFAMIYCSLMETAAFMSPAHTDFNKPTKFFLMGMHQREHL